MIIPLKFSITILLAKYQMYIKKLKRNDYIDMYAYMAYTKKQLNIEIKLMNKGNKQNLINSFLLMMNYNL